MTVTTQRVRTAPDVQLDVRESGRRGNPPVVLCHGFPETSHSWRHQMEPLAAAGYHVLAPDQRGYARSSAPRDIAAYGIDHLAGDLLALLDHVGAERASFVGHDWGALVVWQLGLLHPERCGAVIGASVPFTPWPAPPTELFRALHGDRFFYMLHFQQVGPPEAELEADLRHTMRTVLWCASGDGFRAGAARRAEHGDPEPLPAEGTGFLDALVHATGPVPDELPAWLTPADLDAYVDAFAASGFFGPVSWYRNLDANHARTGSIPPATLTMPTGFIGGTHDGVTAGRPEYVAAMDDLLPNHRGSVMLDGVGHWTQQEAPEQFTAALLDLLDPPAANQPAPHDPADPPPANPPGPRVR